MAIKKKFIGSEQVDGSKIRLLNNQSLVGKDAGGSDLSILKIDSSGKVQLQSLPQVASDPSAGNDIVRKSWADSQLSSKQASLGTGTTSQYLRGDLSWQTINPEVLFYATQAALPVSGDSAVLYGTKDNNKLFRWDLVESPLVPNWTVGPTGDFATLDAALASPSVVNGNVIAVQAGTYTVSSTLVISKQVKIVGAGIGQTILQTAGTGSDPVTMISVTANNVFLKGMTIKHRKSTNSSIETAISVSAGAFPTFTYISGFIMASCRVEYAEFGLVIRGNGFKLASNQFAYATGTVSNSNRSIGIYGSQGNSFIMNNVFDNSVLSSTAFRPIYSTSTNSTSNETHSGSLTISGNSQLGTVQQFYLQDNLRGSAGAYSLYIQNNTINETSVFAGIYLGAANEADLFSQVVVTGNSISNNHETSTGLGKGLFAIDGGTSGASYRSAPLPVHSSGNTLGQLLFRADYSQASGSSGSIVGYKTAAFSAVSVAMDAIIPATPTAPATPGDSVGGYVEVSPALIDDAIVDGVSARAPSQNAVYDALALKLNASEKGAANGVASLGSDGKIPSSQLPAIAINDTFVVSSQSAMLALDAQVGDVAVRTDVSKSFILTASPASSLGNWQEILAAGSVLSVNGQTGVVSISKSDVGLGNVDNTSDADKPVSTATQTALNLKYDASNPAGYVDAAGAAAAAAAQQKYQKITLSAGDISNGYIDLSASVIGTPLVINGPSRIPLLPADDFSVSGARITWNVATVGPGGEEALVEGETIHVFYMA